VDAFPLSLFSTFRFRCITLLREKEPSVKWYFSLTKHSVTSKVFQGDLTRTINSLALLLENETSPVVHRRLLRILECDASEDKISGGNKSADKLYFAVRGRTLAEYYMLFIYKLLNEID